MCTICGAIKQRSYSMVQQAWRMLAVTGAHCGIVSDGQAQLQQRMLGFVQPLDVRGLQPGLVHYQPGPAQAKGLAQPGLGAWCGMCTCVYRLWLTSVRLATCSKKHP